MRWSWDCLHTRIVQQHGVISSKPMGAVPAPLTMKAPNSCRRSGSRLGKLSEARTVRRLAVRAGTRRVLEVFVFRKWRVVNAQVTCRKLAKDGRLTALW